ncbi:MAG: 1-phosphofructokinase [Chloroflexota bacterium]|nr:1-phosphofructokinase [Chloroflexota bacterium]
MIQKTASSISIMIVTVTLNPVLDRTLTVAHIEFDEMTRATATRQDWGGKGFNVSRALLALGLESTAMAFVGGATGETLSKGLAALQIDTDFVPVQEETRTNVVIVDDSNGRYIKVNEPGPFIQPDELNTFVDRVRARVRPGDLWILAGSLPPGVPVDFYARLIQLIQSSGARTVLDASGEALQIGCTAHPYLVKPNAVEANEITGQFLHLPEDARMATELILDQGVELAALSMGADGLTLSSNKETFHARPPAVAIGNPTGAGDALVAGMTYALIYDLPLADVARWGVATGTAAAMSKGVGVGSLEEVEVLLPQIQVWPVTAISKVENHEPR